MAFNPYTTDYDVRSPMGMSPGQRLASALASTTYQQRGAQRSATGQQFDVSRGLGKALPRLNEGFARRGLQDSGLRQVGVSDYLADVNRQQTGISSVLDTALFNLAVENMGVYDEYFGTRYGREFESGFDRAEIAAQIREAIG